MGEIDYLPNTPSSGRTQSPGNTPRSRLSLKTILVVTAISVLVSACKPPEPAKNSEEPSPDAAIQEQIAERTKSIEDVNGQIAALQGRFPAQAEVDTIFQEVRALMDKHKLEITKKEASGSSENPRPFYTEVSHQADVTGSFPEIQGFFRDVATLPRPVTLSNIVLTRAADKRGTLQSTFTIAAYYLTDTHREQQTAPVAPAGTPAQTVMALDERVKGVRERLTAYEDLARAQKGPATILDLIVAKLPASNELQLETIKLQNDSLTISGLTSKDELVSEFGRGLQSDTTGVLQDISFRSEKRGAASEPGTAPSNTNSNSNANTNTTTAQPTGGDGQELGFSITARFVPSRLPQ